MVKLKLKAENDAEAIVYLHEHDIKSVQFEKGYLNYDELKNKYPSLFNAEGDLVINCNVLLPKGVMLPLNPIKPYMSTEYMIKLGFLYSLYNIHTLEELIQKNNGV